MKAAARALAARLRKLQEAFLERGRASLAEARRTGEFYELDTVFEHLQSRLASRLKGSGIEPAAPDAG